MIKSNSSKILIFLIFLVLLISIFSGCTQNTNNSNLNQDEGEDFSFYALDGVSKNLRDYRGTIVILDLMRVYNCIYCTYQFYALDVLSEMYNSDNLTIISIDVSPYETLQDIQNMIDQTYQAEGVLFNWVFGIDSDGDIWNEYQINGGIPTVCIFDKNGNIYYRQEGYHSESVLAEKIDELLE